MIQAIVFDIGNVLLPFDYERAGERLIEMNRPMTPPNRQDIIAAKAELEGGIIERQEFLRRVLPEFDHRGSAEEFLRVWEDIFERNLPMEALVEELSPRYPLYLLSNISDIHREYIHKAYPVFGHFDDGVYSYEAGVMKPEGKIFEIARTQFGVNPDETLYIDDLADNVAAARQAGFISVQYDHRRHGECEKEIRNLLAST